MRGLAIEGGKVETQREFSRLIANKRGLIFHIINKYDFIKDQDKEDYYQEAICFLWERYERFDQTKGSFAVWMYRNTEWAILTYRRSMRWHCEKVKYSDDLISWYDAADEEYNEADIEGLYKAISELSENRQKIVKMFLDGENLKRRALEDGKGATAYSATMHSIRKDILSKHGKYFECAVIDPRKIIKIPNGRTNEKHPNSRPIEMLDMDGKFIKSFPSASEAERNGFLASMVVAVARGRRYSYKGYKWNYVGETVLREKKESGLPRVPVYQQTLTGEIVKRFESMWECRSAGFNPDAIKKNLLGKTEQYRGYKWQYAS